MDDVLQVVGIDRPVISGEVVNMLKELQVKNINLIPVNVKCEDGSINKNYYILQVLSMLDVLDENNSTKLNTMYLEKVYNLDRVPEDTDIFSIEDCFSKVVVSDRVRKAFIKQKFTGWDFHPLTLSKDGVIINEKKERAKSKTNTALHPDDKKILEQGVLTEIVPISSEVVNYFLYKDRIILTIENNRRKQRFLIQIRNDENTKVNQLIARDVLLNVWEYSKKHRIRKNHLCDVLLDNYPMVYAVFDEYTFREKTYLMPISITEAEIIHIEQSEKFDIFDMLKNENIYPFSDFDRDSII